MPRHSKNNTASAVFTYAERDQLKYGTKSQRLGKDSKSNFDSCFLCLQTASDPVSCPLGHIACKECLFESILVQKQEIQAQFQVAERNKAELAEKELAQKREEEKRQLDQIEASISVTGKLDANSAPSNPSLPSFWIPSLTPEAEKAKPTVPEKQRVLCLSISPHPISVRHVFPAKFRIDPESKCQICPSCSKQLKNGLKISILKACGHVLCDTCCQKFVVPMKGCNICDTRCKPKEIVPLVSEGTGFSSMGNAEAKKFEVAFQ